MLRNEPKAKVSTRVISNVPAFRADSDSRLLKALHSISGNTRTGEWDGVTEAGLYAKCGLDVIVCGPGSITQAHQPDESVSLHELRECEFVLGKLANILEGELC